MTEIGHNQEQMYLNNNREQALMQDCLCVFRLTLSEANFKTTLVQRSISSILKR